MSEESRGVLVMLGLAALLLVGTIALGIAHFTRTPIVTDQGAAPAPPTGPESAGSPEGPAVSMGATASGTPSLPSKGTASSRFENQAAAETAPGRGVSAPPSSSSPPSWLSTGPLAVSGVGPSASASGARTVPLPGLPTGSTLPGRAGPATASAETTPALPPAPTGTPDPASDTKPPTILSLQFVPPRVRDGAESSIVVQATDDLSGVRDISGLILSPTGKATIGFSARAQGDSDRLTSTIKVPKDAEAGTWYVALLNVSDKANNAKAITYSASTVPASWTLAVESPDSDSKPPELRSLWLERQSVEERGTQRVFVLADDDRSGVASISGVFQSPSKKAVLGFGLQYSADSSQWAGPLTIPAGADCGDWTLQHVHLVDKAGNSVIVPGTDPRLSRVSFAVTRGGQCDGTPPVLVSVVLSPQAVSNEVASEIEVTAIVTDEGTGTRSVSGRVEGPQPRIPGADTPKIHFYCTSTGPGPSSPWKGKIVVPKFSAAGTWRVTWLYVQDAAGNSQSYSVNDPVLVPAFFQVR